jgi:hypothetical protein
MGLGDASAALGMTPADGRAEGVVASRSVDVDGLAPGLYLVVAEGDGRRQSARLIVAR